MTTTTDNTAPFHWDTSGTERRLIESMTASRLKMGWTQTELARRASERGLKFYQQSVDRYESGVRPLRFFEVLILVELLNVSLDDSLVAPTLRVARELDEAEAMLDEAVKAADLAREAVQRARRAAGDER